MTAVTAWVDLIMQHFHKHVITNQTRTHTRIYRSIMQTTDKVDCDALINQVLNVNQQRRRVFHTGCKMGLWFWTWAQVYFSPAELIKAKRTGRPVCSEHEGRKHTRGKLTTGHRCPLCVQGHVRHGRTETHYEMEAMEQTLLLHDRLFDGWRSKRDSRTKHHRAAEQRVKEKCKTLYYY